MHTLSLPSAAQSALNNIIITMASKRTVSKVCGALCAHLLCLGGYFNLPTSLHCKGSMVVLTMNWLLKIINMWCCSTIELVHLHTTHLISLLYWKNACYVCSRWYCLVFPHYTSLVYPIHCQKIYSKVELSAR